MLLVADHMAGWLVSFEFRTGDEDSSPLTRADIKKKKRKKKNYI